ncbi:MAG: DUF488 domain-containing protein [Elusimicrobia bacterium]|nr:DUF488 domain-containing protein [Elusimicrobiota bacterium]
MANETVYSIGHSNRTLSEFLGLLFDKKIHTLADIRSYPASKYSPQFNKSVLENNTTRAGIRYVFMGKELGGQPGEKEYYDAEGYVLYSEIAKTDFFINGIAKLKGLLQNAATAIMCSEEDPTNCHRRLLVGKVLERQGIRVRHIRGNGYIQTEKELRMADKNRYPNEQDLLFGENEIFAWKSTRSVLQKKQQLISSDF